MPRKSEWLSRVPEALERLDGFPAPVVDRAALEDLLGIHRRMAIRLMHRFGGFQAGRTFLIEKVQLVERLAGIRDSAEYGAERQRWVRFVETLDQARRIHKSRQISIPAAEPGNSKITLEPGRLEVRFTSTVELLQSLLELAQRIGDDFETVRRQIEPDPPSLPRLL